MGDNAGLKMMALGQGLSQLSTGGPVNVAGSPAYQALQQRQQQTQMKEALESSGLMQRFTPEQRAILAQMPPEAAMRIIAGEAFKQPEPAYSRYQEINGQLVDPATGQVVGDYRTPEENEGWRTLTPEEVASVPGLDPTKAYQVGLGGGNDGQIRPVGGSPLVENNMGSSFTPGQEALDKAYAPTYMEWVTGGGADQTTQTAQIKDVLEALEQGQELTGPMVGLQGDLVRSLTNPDAQDAKERVESVVQRNLKAILGAQFTEKEGDRLIARAYNINLPPEKNAARLRALFSAMEQGLKNRGIMAEYFSKNGTLQGFSPVPIPTIDDMIAQMDAAAPAGSTQPAKGPQVGVTEDGYRFLGGDPGDASNWEKVN